MNITKKLSLQ